MFHHSRFGRFSTELQALADLDGYVPEEGDEPESFRFGFDDFVSDFDEHGDGYPGYAAEAWALRVSQCVEAADEATKALRAWRIPPPPSPTFAPPA